MKLFTSFVLALCITACAMTPAQRKQRFIQGAQTCNEICQKNPEIEVYSLNAKGTWATEETCHCNRPEK